MFRIAYVSMDEVSVLFREHCLVTYGRWPGLPIVTINWTLGEMWAKVILGGCVRCRLGVARCNLTSLNNFYSTLSSGVKVKLEVFHPEVLQYTNKYYTSVNNRTFILCTIVYMSGRHVST